MRTLAPIAALAIALAFMAPARAEDKAKTGSIKGTVLSQDGKPAANVNVRLTKPRAGGRGPATQPAAPQAAAPGSDDKPPQEGPAPAPPGQPGQGRNRPLPPAIKTAVTDADGKFAMDDVPPGEYRVAAGGPGLGMGRESVTVKAGETATVEIKLQPPRQPQ